ncbi:unnamed protein product [Lasius platythorax]|uniref:Uncharacterized protein n=1 Tax=Lasius platythorax TaxID=488582 RepID=A0AAV2NLD6_9HYME
MAVCYVITARYQRYFFRGSVLVALAFAHSVNTNATRYAHMLCAWLCVILGVITAIINERRKKTCRPLDGCECGHF